MRDFIGESATDYETLEFYRATVCPTTHQIIIKNELNNSHYAHSKPDKPILVVTKRTQRTIQVTDCVINSKQVITNWFLSGRLHSDNEDVPYVDRSSVQEQGFPIVVMFGHNVDTDVLRDKVKDVVTEQLTENNKMAAHLCAAIGRY